jgi:lysine-N-methylase
VKTLSLYAPSYYKEFECIKGECKHSCCIGWEIDVDRASLEKYNNLTDTFGKTIRDSVADGENPHFMLSGNRCPHLDKDGLCRIISTLGEDYLCDICRLHPRFFNVTKRGVEVGLGASCEEAARIILSSDGYCDIVKIGEEVCEPLDFDALPLRDAVYAILSNRDKPYTERLYEIYKAFSVSPALLSDLEWRSVLSSLEYLDGEDKELFQCFSSDIISTEYDIVLERALAYFVYRHASSAENTEEFRIRIGFALVLERLLASCIKATNIPAAELLRTISEEIEYSFENTDVLIAEIEFSL